MANKSLPFTPARASAQSRAQAVLPLFDWGRDQALMADPAVRRLVRVRRISPVLASVYVELIGLGGRHG